MQPNSFHQPENQSTFIPLEAVRIASPCRADWDKMQGDERVRFCGTCAKNVYNLSSLSRKEAEKLIQEKEGQLCVRFYQRADGTMLTDNCPVGLKIVRRPFQWLVAGFAALMASGAAVVASHNNPKTCDVPTIPGSVAASSLRDKMPFQWVFDYFYPRTQPQPIAMTGAIAAPPIMGKPAMPQPKPTAAPKPEMGELAPPQK